MNDLRKLLLGQVLGAYARVNVRALQNLFRVGRADAIDVAQRNFDALVRRNFHSNDTGHRLLNR
jgi:hypothetical protein